VVVCVEQVIRPPDFLPDVPAVRALTFPDEEACRASQLLRDPVRDLGQIVEIEAQVVGPGTGLGAPVLDHLHVLRPVGGPGDVDFVPAAGQEPLDRGGAGGVEWPVFAGRRHNRASEIVTCATEPARAWVSSSVPATVKA
jgi:hypothetical protein